MRDCKVTKAPYFVNRMKLIFLPDFEAIPAATTLAEAPTNVPLPPRQAPKDKDHHKAYLMFSQTSGVAFICEEILFIKPEFPVYS